MTVLGLTDGSGSLHSIRVLCETQMNVSECIINVFRRVDRGRKERVRPLGRAESLFSRARDSKEAPGR